MPLTASLLFNKSSLFMPSRLDRTRFIIAGAGSSFPM